MKEERGALDQGSGHENSPVTNEDDLSHSRYDGYRLGSRILGVLVAMPGAALLVLLVRVVADCVGSSNSSGPLITLIPSGWFLATLLGGLGLPVVGVFLAIAVGALLARPWASQAALILALIGLGLMLLIGSLTVISAGQPLILLGAAPFLLVALLAGLNLRQLRSARQVRRTGHSGPLGRRPSPKADV